MSNTVDCFIISQAIKKPKLAQICVFEKSSLLLPKLENQAPQILSKSSFLSLIDLNLGFHDSVWNSPLKKANLKSHNTQNQLFVLEDRATLLSTTLQSAVVVPLTPTVTTINMDFSKYPNYVYFASIGRL